MLICRQLGIDGCTHSSSLARALSLNLEIQHVWRADVSRGGLEEQDNDSLSLCPTEEKLDL
jgi:hypothetical protein